MSMLHLHVRPLRVKQHPVNTAVQPPVCTYRPHNVALLVNCTLHVHMQAQQHAPVPPDCERGCGAAVCTISMHAAPEGQQWDQHMPTPAPQPLHGLQLVATPFCAPSDARKVRLWGYMCGTDVYVLTHLMRRKVSHHCHAAVAVPHSNQATHTTAAGPPTDS